MNFAVSNALSDFPKRQLSLPVLLAMALAVFAVVGINIVGWLHDSRLGFPDPRSFENAFFVTAARTEPAGLALLLGFLLLAVLLGIWKRVPRFPLEWWPGLLRSRFAVPLLAAAVVAASAAGSSLVFHDRALAADENMPNFQARIFLGGHWQGELPPQLRFLSVPLQPLLSEYFPATGRWNSSYLPVYAALRTPFIALGMERWVNALLSGISILALAGIIRRLWPERRLLPLFGTLLLATSSQFLINGMAAYSMPAHLALNLVWLWLYLQPGSRWFWTTPILGVLAMGLHHPFVHALFAAPFLLRLVLDRRWKAVAWFAPIYALGIAGWWYWWRIFRSDTPNGISVPWALNPHFWLTHSLTLCELISWTAFPVALLALLALSRWRKLPPLVQDCAASCLLTFGFFLAISIDQGLGWGYRYFHGALGCLILLAVAGWPVLVEKIGIDRGRWMVVSGLALSASFQIPLRCWQAEKFARPFAKAEAAFSQMDADLVVFDLSSAWYCRDLIRNDPFLRNRPLVACVYKLNAGQSAVLKALFPRVHLVEKAELAAYGLSTQTAPANLQ